MRADDLRLYREQLLGVLKEAPHQGLTVAEVAVKANKRVISKVRDQLNWLAADGKVLKVPGRGAAFAYKLRGPVEPQLAPVREVSPSGFAQLLRSLAVNKWTSKTVKSSAAIPYSITKLYHYAHDVATGGVRKQEDYDAVRAELRTYRDDLISSLATVEGMLARTELWNAKDSAKWLLSAGGSSQEYDTLASQAEMRQL